MITVIYMTGGVHVCGSGYDIRLRNPFAAWYIVSMSGLPCRVRYTNELIGSVAD